jgi:3-oxoadipate enol-lactonase
MPRVKTDDGVEIHYHVDDFRDPWLGDGDTIVMAHGFARNIKWWTQWVPALSRKYRVVRFDVRGCGESSAPPEGASWTADRVAKDAINLIDHLGIAKVHWVGFESGGMWGKVFAINHPDRVKTLTVLNTPSAMAGREITSVDKSGASGSDLVAKIGFRQWLTDTFATRMDMSMADPRIKEWHISEQCKTPESVVRGLNEILETLDLSGKYPAIKCPTLIMFSDKAHNCPVAEQRAIQDAIEGNTNMVVFSNIAAGAQLLIPDRCTEEVLRFLGSL